MRRHEKHERLTPGIVRQPALILALLALLLLSACSPGGVFSAPMAGYPQREMPVEPERALEMLRAVGRADVDGAIVWSDAEFTGLLNAQLQQLPPEQNPVRDVKVWFEPETIFLQTTLREGMVPGIGSDLALNLAASVAVRNGKPTVSLEQLGIGYLPVLPDTVLDPLNEQLTQLLLEAGPLPFDVTIETGAMRVTVP